MTPVVARTAYSTLALNVPTNIKNSPTKPFMPGKPIEDSVTIIKKTANIGIDFARPPKSAIILVCLLSYSIPTSKNNAPVLKP